MLLFCKKNNVEVSAYSVLTPTFIIEPFFIVRRIGMTKPPVKLGVGKNILIEKERTSWWYNDSGLATTSLYVKEVRCQ